VSGYCSLFSKTFYGLLFSYLTITDVTSYVHHKLPVSFLLHIATKKTCQINQIITVNSSMNAPIFETYSSQKNNSCMPCVPMFWYLVITACHFVLGFLVLVYLRDASLDLRPILRFYPHFFYQLITLLGNFSTFP